VVDKSALTMKHSRRECLAVAAIRLDFQPRENLIEETVQKYVERLRRGGRLRPLRVRFDGEEYFLEDGFHRLEAARRVGIKTIEVESRPGTLAEMEAEFDKYLERLKAKLRRPI
jgi:hypothetical protein